MVGICFECNLRAKMAASLLTEVKHPVLSEREDKRRQKKTQWGFSCWISRVTNTFYWFKFSIRVMCRGRRAAVAECRHKNTEKWKAEILKRYVCKLLRMIDHATEKRALPLCRFKSSLIMTDENDSLTVRVTVRWVHKHYGLAAQCSEWLPPQTLLWL